MKGRLLHAGLAAEFASAICPDDKKYDLDQCRSEAIDFRAKVLQIASQQDPADLFFVTDIFEIREKFSSYSDMMDIFAQQDEGGDEICTADDKGELRNTTRRQQYSGTYYLTRTAAQFMKSYRNLPKPVQSILDRSLNMQVGPIVNHLQQSSIEAILQPQP
jgi:hypothetical protein